MRASRLWILGALALGLATQFACERKEDGGYGMAGKRTKDNAWLVKAAESNLAEIDAGRLAETKGDRTEVKQFARHMVEEHTNLNVELAALAEKKAITLPARAGEKQQRAVAELSELTGAEFDKKFADMTVSDHEKAVSLFESNSNAADPDVKAFAEKTLPTLQHHLQMARELKTKVSVTPKAD
jgi:putative membrane protein